MASRLGVADKRYGAVRKMIHRQFGEDYDPLVRLLEVGEEAREVGDLATAGACFGKAVGYLWPALKSAEVKVDQSLRVVAVRMTGVQDPEGQVLEHAPADRLETDRSDQEAGIGEVNGPEDGMEDGL